MLLDSDSLKFYQGSAHYHKLSTATRMMLKQRLSFAGPFIKLGPLRNVPEVAETAGVLSAAGLVIILTLW